MTAALTHTALPAASRAGKGTDSAAGLTCFHCGTACLDRRHQSQERIFCCAGCQTVHELLHDNGLDSYYALNRTPGKRMDREDAPDRYGFLDEPTVRERLLDFASERTERVTFHIPAIHCVACVWLLENLFRLLPGIGKSTVNFLRREVAISFDPRQIRLSQVAQLVDSLGYPPDLKLADLDGRRGSAVPSRLWLRLGVAAFAFGNTMLFSLPGYFGLDAFSGPAFQQMFGFLSLILGIPVVLFSASDYWQAAWNSLRQRRLSIEVPIALGIAALFVQSAYEVLSGHGEGYFDSMAGLLFFLLSGRIFQHKAYDRLTFDRDYRAFFPLSVLRLHQESAQEERVSLAQLSVGDRLRIRHGELVPADSRLLRGEALMDYSFVTGESDPIPCQPGALLHAGGCQAGGTIDVEITKPVSQSYLTSLWNQEAFRKEKGDTFDTLTNRYSVRFTWIILAIATVAGAYWWAMEPARSVRAFVGVLIVACPCALALAAPFTLGTAVRALGRRGIFLRNAQVIETLGRIDSVVFDKTGTLTSQADAEMAYEGQPLTDIERNAICRLARQSAHPLATRLVRLLGASVPDTGAVNASIDSFRESVGKGLLGRVGNQTWWLGSAAWLRENGIEVPNDVAGTAVYVACDGVLRGRFQFTHALRSEVGQLIQSLAGRFELALLSGDNDREAARFRNLFPAPAHLQFHQSPADKLEFIRERQQSGKTVMMVGDGLNDAGALRQSDVGVAVVEEIGAFSPASDVIVQARRVPQLAELLGFAGSAIGVVRMSFLISTLYNVVGISIAAAGRLSPVVCAVLMPLSSITVVVFAVGAVHWTARRARLGPPLDGSSMEALS